MAISIINITPLASPNGIFSPNDIPASTAGNTLVVAIAWNSGGSMDTSSSVTDNVSNEFTQAAGGDFGTGDVWYAETAGGANSINVHEPVFFNAWCYELHSDSGPIELLYATTSGGDSGSNVSSFGMPIDDVTVTFTPDFPAQLQVAGAVFTDGEDLFYVATCNYFAAPSTGTTKIASVNSPWTLESYVADPYDYNYDFGAAHYLTAAPPATDFHTYEALGGFTASAVEHKSDASPDNQEVTHFIDADIISEDDLRAGLYDFADVELRVVSWRHPEAGCLKLLKGTLGQVSMKNGLASTELRGQTQKLSNVIGSTHGPVCRAGLFDGKFASGDPVADPSNHWRCRKDPTAYTYTNAVGSSPDAVTIVPATALPDGSGSLPTSNNTKVTLNGVAVQAAFVASTNRGSFNLACGGDGGVTEPFATGQPYFFDSDHLATIAAAATGNSLMFNANGLYSSVPTESPINWNTLNSVGNFVSASQPWDGAVQNWEVMLYGQFYIPVAGHVTFNVQHDDGVFWAVQPTDDHPTDYVTVVSGPVCPPFNQATNPLNQAKTAFNGYHFNSDRGVAADNRSGNRLQPWTLNFPVAGTYNFEFCFTNWEHRQQLIVTVTGQGNIPPDNLSAAAGVVSGWFDGGAIKFTSGALENRVYDVQTVDGDGNIKLFAGAPLPFAPAPGDTFIIQAGCNHLISDCHFKFANVANFAGENQMPGQLVILTTPDTH